MSIEGGVTCSVCKRTYKEDHIWLALSAMPARHEDEVTYLYPENSFSFPPICSPSCLEALAKSIKDTYNELLQHQLEHDQRYS